MDDQSSVPDAGGLLRKWREHRHVSQFELANDADIAPRHLGAFEAGKSRPDKNVLLRLAERLDMPLRQRNRLLLAAGFQAAFVEHSFADPPRGRVRMTVETMLEAHEPNPAFAADRHWTLVAPNRALSYLLTGADPGLLLPPVNMARLLLHPAGLAMRIVNVGQWRVQIIARLRRQVDLTGDRILMDLLDEIRDYPGGEDDVDPGQPLLLSTVDGDLAFILATTQFSTAIDITISEMAIETFVPADSRTAAVLQRVASRQIEPVE